MKKCLPTKDSISRKTIPQNRMWRQDISSKTKLRKFPASSDTAVQEMLKYSINKNKYACVHSLIIPLEYILLGLKCTEVLFISV